LYILFHDVNSSTLIAVVTVGHAHWRMMPLSKILTMSLAVLTQCRNMTDILEQHARAVH